VLRLALFPALVLAAFTPAAYAAQSDASDPAALVRHLYEVKRAEVAQWKAPWSPARRAAFAAMDAAFRAALSRELAHAFEVDAREGGGGPSRFNADPLLWGQEFDDDVLRDLRIELLSRAWEHARVRARFTNSIVSETKPVEVLFELRLEAGRWRVADIRSSGQSLAATLAGH